jgi:rhodanese-related sulfurtransferase
MNYTDKFQSMADEALARVAKVAPEDVDQLHEAGAILLDIRDPDEHAAGHIKGSMHISRGKLEMLVEKEIPDSSAVILCYCNADNRGGLSAASLRDMGYSNAKVISGGYKAYNSLSETAK